MTPLRARLLPLALLAALSLLAAPAARAGDAFADYEKAVEAALKSKDPEARGRAFQPLSTCADPRAIDLILKSVRDLVAGFAKLRGEQTSAEKSYESAITERQALSDDFQATGDTSSRAMDAYNKKERKLSREVDEALLKVRTLENDFSRVRGLIDAGVIAMGKVLGNLDEGDFAPAMDALDKAWLRSKTPGDAVHWVDAVAGLGKPGVEERLCAVMTDETLGDGVKAATIGALAALKHPRTLAVAIGNLSLDKDRLALVAASIRALRLLHDKRGIEPLIEFLGREDTGRLREDARGALVSLTGKRHGPFKAPWKAWWAESGAGFAMPESPQPEDEEDEHGPGVTFYGIHTFSDRILFILDVSGSMDQAAKPGPQGGEPKPRLAIAKKELVGAINNQDDGHRFNVIFFNHEVVPWQPSMMVVSETTKRQAKGWIESRSAVGGTNIYDALEGGFTIATRTTGRPEIDTIFFLTDGKPTAGKVQEPQRILEAVREWNRTANLKIHVVGVGPPEDIDEPFLKELAKIGEGKYVNRR